jgi:thiol-disulfide isomerase/thioredoxin
MSNAIGPDADQPELPAQPIWRRAAALGFISLIAIAVVYGTTRHGGKETGDSGECGPAAAMASRLAPLAVGDVAALTMAKTPRLTTELTFNAPDGRPISLSDFRGRTVLLNLWATWCVPCRLEMPALDRLQAKFGGSQFEVVAINIDTARLERRQAFLTEAGVKSLAFYADPKADVFQTLKRAGKVVGLPTTILIDPKGCELGSMAGPAEWDSHDAFRLIGASLGH